MQKNQARLEVLSQEKVVHEDTSLSQRIPTLIREQGITIKSILTALSFPSGGIDED